jgi:DnaJ-class molecular chaperone
MNFRLFTSIEVRNSIKKRKVQEEINKEAGGQAYVKCKNCEGTGVRFFTWGETGENTGWSGEYCIICGGTGYVDWVEVIIKPRR